MGPDQEQLDPLDGDDEVVDDPAHLLGGVDVGRRRGGGCRGGEGRPGEHRRGRPGGGRRRRPGRPGHRGDGGGR
jgi:hypothetical protein